MTMTRVCENQLVLILASLMLLLCVLDCFQSHVNKPQVKMNRKRTYQGIVAAFSQKNFREVMDKCTIK